MAIKPIDPKPAWILASVMMASDPIEMHRGAPDMLTCGKCGGVRFRWKTPYMKWPDTAVTWKPDPDCGCRKCWVSHRT